MTTLKIYSGGQTGVDRAALDAAKQHKIEHGGWCPKGRKAEDGIIDQSYLLIETNSFDYRERTRLNVQDSDGTLILFKDTLEGGTRYTYDCTIKIQKPTLLINLDTAPDYKNIINWLRENKISLLNVAGPRESKNPGIYASAKNILSTLIAQLSIQN